MTWLRLLALFLFLQRETPIQPPAAAQDAQYGRRFFVQLKAIFGRFRESDLQRVFETAKPTQCAELLSDTGTWKTVAFFNERRELGDWYRNSFEEVKGDLSSFVFKGVCRGERGPVQLTTKFPVKESGDAYAAGKIPFEEIEVNVNAPVSAFYDPIAQTYSWDLPYLFHVRSTGDDSLYSLAPESLRERSNYAPEVLDHWDCKTVSADAVTYRFLICRTTTLPRDPRQRQPGRAAFGASAYFILSDGKEALSSVKLSFADDSGKTVADNSAPPPVEAEAPVTWISPDADEKLLSLERDGFRIRFAPETWRNKLSAAQVLYGQTVAPLASTSPPAGTDYCVWLPGSTPQSLLAADPDSILYFMSARDADGPTATSITMDLKSRAGVQLGSLRCTFPRATSAASVAFGRWTTVVGNHLTLEIRQ